METPWSVPARSTLPRTPSFSARFPVSRQRIGSIGSSMWCARSGVTRNGEIMFFKKQSKSKSSQCSGDSCSAVPESSTLDSITSKDGFVPATHWNEMRKYYGSEPSQVRGLRLPSIALQSENPELADIPALMNRRAQWNLSFLPDANPEYQFSPATDLTSEGVDSCFCSEAFLDDVAWLSQTIEIRLDAEEAMADSLDLELGLMETVQDLSRILAKTPARRSSVVPQSPVAPSGDHS